MGQRRCHLKLSKTEGIATFGARFTSHGETNMGFVCATAKVRSRSIEQWNKSRAAHATAAIPKMSLSDTNTRRALPKYVPDRKRRRALLFLSKKGCENVYIAASRAGRRLRQRNLEENYFSK